MVCLLTAWRAAQAAMFVVDSTADSVDATPSDGRCADSRGRCTLRAAIQQANSSSTPDTILLDAKTYTITISNAGLGENDAVRGDLDIKQPVSIIGAGAPITIIDGGGLDRVFDIFAPTTISALTIRNGHSVADGGAIENFEKLTLNNVSVAGNTADGDGGGVSTVNDVTFTNVTVSGNTTAAMHVGGGISHDGGTLTLVNVTVSGNGAAAGGGLENADSAVLTNVTIANDTGGGFDNQGSFNIPPGTAMLNNVLLANNGTNCTGGMLTGNAHNMETGASCLFGAAGSNKNPLLGPLADNGGPTFTHALGAGSPAIDTAGSPCPNTDQRGAARPVDGNGDSVAVCDIGAYEFNGVPPTTTTSTSTSTTTTTMPSRCLLDVDGNGHVEVSTDMVYIARHLLGLTPVPPSFRTIDPTIPPDSTIAAAIEVARPSLDVDGDGRVGVSTDIVYIARHLAGLTPVPPSFRTTDPTIPPDATIAANIDALCP
jgi:CSLREA domain-containing protein